MKKQKQRPNLAVLVPIFVGMAVIAIGAKYFYPDLMRYLRIKQM